MQRGENLFLPVRRMIRGSLIIKKKKNGEGDGGGKAPPVFPLFSTCKPMTTMTAETIGLIQ